MSVPAGPEVDVLRRTAQDLTRGIGGDFERVQAVVGWFRSEFTYALEVTEFPGLAGMVEFLNARRGPCTYYAGASALMLRSLGVPTRIATGFLAQEYDADLGLYTVTTREGHAWIEVYFEGFGWVTFDPTPTEQRAAALEAMFQLEDDPQGLRPWAEELVGSLERWAESGGEVSAMRDFAVQLGRGPRAAWESARRAPLLALAVGAVLVLVWLLPRLRRRARVRASQSAEPADPHTASLTQALLAALERRGYPKPRTHTLREFAAAVMGAAGPELEPLGAQAELLYRARFGQVPLTPPRGGPPARLRRGSGEDPRRCGDRLGSGPRPLDPNLDPHMVTPRSACFLLSPLVLLSACGGGGGSSDGTPTGTVDALVSSTAGVDLFAMTATLSRVELLRADGSKSANLLAAPRAVELSDLEDFSLWAAGTAVPVGEYTGARLVFQPGSLEALDAAGGALSVTAQGHQLEGTFETPLVVEEGAVSRVDLYLDLVAALDEAPGAADLSFEPEGSVRVIDVDEVLPLQEFRGLVVAEAPDEGTLDVQVFADSDLEQPLRVAQVALAPDTVLIDLGDQVFADAVDFFAAVQPGSTVVDVEGRHLGHGAVDAATVEIVDQLGDPVPTVVADGKILFVDEGAQEFVFLLQELVSGAELAAPVLESLGDPSSIDVTWDDGTAFFDGDDGTSGPEGLTVGQMARVEFREFVWPPFPAAKVEFEELSVTGTIHDVAGLPESFVLAKGGGELVTVALDDDTDLRLDIQFKPAILVEELVVGMKATVKGDPDGDDADDLDAASVKVHHGHLNQAPVSAAEAPAALFWSDEGKIVQTFGVGAPDFPLAIQIQPGCLFKQDAASVEGFFELVSAGDVEVHVKGIGSPLKGEVRAYEVKAKAK